MFDPKIPDLAEGLEPLADILEAGDEPVILTVYDLPHEWAWDLLPPRINVQVTLDVQKTDRCGHSHELSGQHPCVLNKGHKGAHYSPLDAHYTSPLDRL